MVEWCAYIGCVLGGIRGDGRRDTRSDIYLLRVLLYKYDGKSKHDLVRLNESMISGPLLKARLFIEL